MSLDGFISGLNWRYATKSFDPTKKLTSEFLNKLLEATHLSPSSFGLQPWKFFVVEDSNIRKKLQEHAWKQPQIVDCSHLVVMATRLDIDKNYINAYADQIAQERDLPQGAIEPYREMMLGSLGMMQGEPGKAWMSKQVYIALGILLAACADARIDACPMEGFDPQKFDEILELPAKGFNARVLCALGYRSASDKNATAKKIRFPPSAVVEII